VKTKLLIPIAFIAVLAFFAGCKDDEPAPTACFTTASSSIDDDISPLAGEEIEFESCSENATEFEWDFGDDETSDEENPTYAYQEAGDYTVTLTATGAGGSAESSEDIEVLDLTGDWDATLLVGTSQVIVTMNLEQQGTELTGSTTDIDGSYNLTSGSVVENREVTIKFTVPYTTDMPFKLVGDVNDDADEMEGTFTITGFTTTGTWSATKSKKSTVSPKDEGLKAILK
jgi:PKD repeat protein